MEITAIRWANGIRNAVALDLLQAAGDIASHQRLYPDCNLAHLGPSHGSCFSSPDCPSLEYLFGAVRRLNSTDTDDQAVFMSSLLSHSIQRMSDFSTERQRYVQFNVTVNGAGRRYDTIAHTLAGRLKSSSIEHCKNVR